MCAGIVAPGRQEKFSFSLSPALCKAVYCSGKKHSLRRDAATLSFSFSARRSVRFIAATAPWTWTAHCIEIQAHISQEPHSLASLRRCRTLRGRQHTADIRIESLTIPQISKQPRRLAVDGNWRPRSMVARENARPAASRLARTLGLAHQHYIVCDPGLSGFRRLFRLLLHRSVLLEEILLGELYDLDTWPV